jgi:hypothetical protein
MDSKMREIFWNQFGAAIDMLENAIVACTDELWNTKDEFWYKAYHTLFYLDYYLTVDPQGFEPPAPFTLSEFDPSGILPDQVYSKDDLLNYLGHCRNKCHALIGTLTALKAEKRWINEYRNYSILEILIYNMRHVQHHTAQLNLILRQGINDAPRWVSQAKQKL